MRREGLWRSWMIAVLLLLLLGAAPPLTKAQEGAAVPTFAKDVAPILYEKCVGCHRAGEVAPMALETYAQTRPWARAIKLKTRAREMPPWHASVAESLPMRNDRSLSEDEIAMLAAWADGGAPEGDAADLPPAPTFREGWQHPSGRDPDVIVPMPVEYEVPAEGMLDYLNFFAKMPLEEDAILEAVEARPDNRAVVHHFAAGVARMAEPPPPGPIDLGSDALNIPQRSPTDPPRERRRGGGGGSLVVYVPGAGFDQYPEGYGRRIAGGPDAYATFQMHYRMTGKPERDRSRIGLWLRQGHVERVIVDSGGQAGTIVAQGKEILWEPGRPAPLTYANIPNIPPFAEDFEAVMIVPFAEAVDVYSLNPHAHVRAKSFNYRVVYPDGRQQVILQVPQYDFNWQLLYELEEPLHLPAGSTMIVTAHYDNSINNKYNPAPDAEVVWGDQSWDEMFVPFIEFARDARGGSGTSQEE